MKNDHELKVGDEAPPLDALAVGGESGTPHDHPVLHVMLRA